MSASPIVVSFNITVIINTKSESKGHSKRELTRINIYIQDARKMFSLHYAAPPAGSPPWETFKPLGVKTVDSTPWLTEERSTLHGSLCPLQTCSSAAWLCSAFLFVTHPQNHSGLDGRDRSQATSSLWQVMDYSDLYDLLSLGAKAKGLLWKTVQFLLFSGLLVHLELPMSFLAMLWKLFGLKISSSIPGMSVLVWMCIYYLWCCNTFTVGKSTVNYICYSIYKIIY